VKTEKKAILEAVLKDYQETSLLNQVDYKKYYLYSLIAHSTAIEGSTLTEEEAILLLDKGLITAPHTKYEVDMNADLRDAYEISYTLAHGHVPYTLKMLQKLSAVVMKNTGKFYSLVHGEYDERKGDYSTALSNMRKSIELLDNTYSYSVYNDISSQAEKYHGKLQKAKYKFILRISF